MTFELEEKGRKRKTENHLSKAAVSHRLKNPTHDLPILIHWNSKKRTYCFKSILLLYDGQQLPISIL